MKKIICLCVFATLFLVGVSSQTKEDNIRTLMIMSGSGNLGIQVIEALIPQFSKMLPGVPNDYWKNFRNKIDVNELIELVIPIYSKYYTDEDIKQLIDFYKTEIGQKMIKLAPLMMQESMTVGQEWGKKISEELIKELTEDGYISA